MGVETYARTMSGLEFGDDMESLYACSDFILSPNSSLLVCGLVNIHRSMFEACLKPVLET